MFPLDFILLWLWLRLGFGSGSEFDETNVLDEMVLLGFGSESDREMELLGTGLGLTSTNSIRDVVFCSDDHWEFELLDEQRDELKFEEEVVREHDDIKLESKSVDSLTRIALLWYVDLMAFSVDNDDDDSFVSDVADDLDELLLIFFFACFVIDDKKILEISKKFDTKSMY